METPVAKFIELCVLEMKRALSLSLRTRVALSSVMHLAGLVYARVRQTSRQRF